MGLWNLIGKVVCYICFVVSSFALLSFLLALYFFSVRNQACEVINSALCITLQLLYFFIIVLSVTQHTLLVCCIWT